MSQHIYIYQWAAEEVYLGMASDIGMEAGGFSFDEKAAGNYRNQWEGSPIGIG